MSLLNNNLKFWLRYRWHRHIRKTRFVPENPVFFIHIPKTAGTSFRNMLFRMVDQEVSFPNFQDMRENNGVYPPTQDLPALLPTLHRELRFLTGHYPYAVGSLFSVTPQYYIFLREPISRTLSNLLHFQRNKPENAGLSLVEIFDKYQVHLQNLQTRYLCDPSMDQLNIFFRPRLLTEKDLKQAKKHLANCTFIGLTEAFEESVRIAEQLLQIPLGQALIHNVTPPQNNPLTDELIRHISPYLQYDLELYDYACTLFEELKSSVLKTDSTRTSNT